MRLFFAVFVMLLMSAPAAQAQQTCLNMDIQQQVKALMQESTPESRRAISTKQVEIGIAKGIIKAEHKDDVVRALVEYTIRKEGACTFPPELNARVSNALAIVPAGGKPCAEGQYDKVIDRQFAALKASNGFVLFENVIKQQVSANVVPSAREKFIAKWDGNSGFRERVIRAGLELSVMYNSKCTNLTDPVLGIIAEF